MAPGPSHYPNQCWNIVNCTINNKIQGIQIEIKIFSYKKMNLKTSSALWPVIFFRNLQDYRKSYNEAFEYKLEAIISQIDGVTRDLELFLHLNTLASDSDLDLIISTSENLHNKLKITRKYLGITVSSLHVADYELHNDAPEYHTLSFPTPPCTPTLVIKRTAQSLLDETLANIKQLSNSSSVSVIGQTLTTPSYKRLLSALREFSSVFSSCYGDYKRRLDVLIGWHEALELVDNDEQFMGASFELDIDVSNNLPLYFTFRNIL